MSEIAYIKLSDLAKQVESVIRQSFGDEYWIVAEISGHKFYPNQDRHYFEFVEKAEGTTDPVAKVRGVAWYSGAQTIKLFEKDTGQIFTNGLQVLVRVKVEFHPQHGFSLVLNDIDQSFTLGNLEKQRRETLLRLVADNPEAIQKVGDEYITKNKRIRLNAIIQNIAIIGSPNSEGYTDFTHTISNNQFGYKFKIDIYQSSVQGSEAEKEMISRLIAIHQSGKPYDAVVIIRGGGAKTDFIVFDSYGLSRVAARFPIPVITGIGHHKDVSIVDLMVHTTTKTPTKAAEFIISHNRSFEERILVLQKTIAIKSQQLLSNASQKINAANLTVVNKTRTLLSHHQGALFSYHQTVTNKTKTILYNRKTNLVALLNQLSSKPMIIAANKRSELNNLITNLKAFSGKYIVNQRGYLGHYSSVVKLMSPQSLMKKGFAIVSHKGKIVTDAETIEPGADLSIAMSNYQVNTKVISKTKTDGESDL